MMPSSVNRAIVSFIALALVMSAAQARPADLDQQRRDYYAALDALKARDHARFQQILARQQDYVLLPYLEYEFLKDRLDTVQSDKVRQFLAANDDTPLADILRRKWLRVLAARGDWKTFMREYRGLDGDTELRCLRLKRVLQTAEDKSTAMAVVGRLWLNGDRLPSVCEDVFSQWRRAGYLTNDLAWARIRLAMERRNLTLATALAPWVDAKERVWVGRWVAMHRDPARQISKISYPVDTPLAREVVRYGVARLAYNDVAVAAQEWRRLRETIDFSEDDVRYVTRSLGLLAAQGHMPEAVGWLGQIQDVANDENVRQWRVRTAVRAGDWEAANRFMEGLTARERQDGQWRYWQARTLEKLGFADKARSLFTTLAGERSYYGFLAADRLRLPYYIQTVVLEAKPDETQAIMARRDVQMAQELYTLGDLVGARRQWEYATRRMSNRELQVAALAAASWGWHDRAILTVGKTDHLDDLELRFPLLYRAMVEENAQASSIDPGWVYGVMRQESAFNVEARSQAGALGLMQLMPQTGRFVARILNLKIRSNEAILRVENNLRLGAAYLRTVLDQNQGHQVLATAAYNAGPNRARIWLPADDHLDADIWVDNIPYTETRNYVKNVMAFTTVYDYRLGFVSNRLQQRMPPVPRPS